MRGSWLDHLYVRSKVADLTAVPKFFLDELAISLSELRPLRKRALGLFQSNGSKYKIPLAGDFSRVLDTGSQAISVRGRSAAVQLKDENGYVVLKGLPIGELASGLYRFLPERMDPFLDTMGTLREPQPSWVILGSETYHTAKNEALLSLAIHALNRNVGVRLRAPTPVGILSINTVNLQTGEKVPVHRILKNNTASSDTLTDERLCRFFRFEYLAGDPDLAKLKNTKPASNRQFLSMVMESWRPKVYCYFTQTDPFIRLESWDVRPLRGSREIRPLESSVALKALSLDGTLLDQSVKGRFRWARAVCQSLGDIGAIHSLRGDVGSRRGAPHPKDLTLNGVMHDLHSGMLPLAGGCTYDYCLGGLKRFANRNNARKSIAALGRVLELAPRQLAALRRVYNQRYAWSAQAARKWQISIKG